MKPDEAKFIGMAVVSMLEQLKDTSQNQLINWNPESRKDIKDMLNVGSTLKIKMERLGFDMRPLPSLADGEENDYLTKES